jgi:site-specific DNA recombinase
MKTGVAKPVRCAIYTRVSTDQGLEQDFNSLDAQRDAAEAYIRSQAHAAWALIRSQYNDGGYSGGSTDRPALQRLLSDVRARKVDIIVVYKVDRLTRSLADFAKLVELFDGHGVSFVSVTQQFNTTTSMGRLTLNVLLSFAQFEREVTSERIRDKIAASKRKGLWVGGMVPLGYKVKNCKVVMIKSEADRVRTIFHRYLELGSLNLLMQDLRQRKILTKVRRLSSGRAVGGNPLTRGPLAHLLRNRFYIGEVAYRGEVLPGEQPAILDQKLFEAVQRKLDEQRTNHSTKRATSESLLTGRIFDDRGNRMTAPGDKLFALQELVDRIGAAEARDAEEGRERLGVAERGGDRIDAAVNLALDPLHRQALEGVRMVLAVSADGVAFVVDAPHDGRIGTRHLADQEIGGLHALRCQCIENDVGIGRQRAVVESEDYLVVVER